MNTTTTIPDAITNQNIIDSRDVIARIEYLEGVIQDAQDDLEAEQDETKEHEEATCGACGLSWNDAAVSSRTPTPGGRCPFENIHEEVTELKALQAFADEASDCASDWQYGEVLIHDSYFEEYAQQLAEDIGDVPDDLRWPYTCIDWAKAARELQMDYTAVDFDGETYWTR